MAEGQDPDTAQRSLSPLLGSRVGSGPERRASAQGQLEHGKDSREVRHLAKSQRPLSCPLDSSPPKDVVSGLVPG